MQYGFFDEEHREYVITDPRTPAPWTNYLGSPEYGAIITNAAGGYSFASSGADGRILRYVFNQSDEPGRYLYIRDNDDGDFWSVSWQPVGKDLSLCKYECRHGTSYTKMSADYREIHAEALYYVPLNAKHEVWELTVRNNSDRPRPLTLTGFAAFTNHPNYEQDQVNLQYSLFVTRTCFRENRIIQQLHGNLDGLKDGEMIDNKVATERFFGLAGAPVSSCCGDKDEFLGPYRHYDRPAGVSSGDLGGAQSYCGSSCGALSAAVTLAPGQSKTVAFIAGLAYDREAQAILAHYHDPARVCAEEAEALTEFWHSRLRHFQVRTPSSEFDTMVNTWNAFNCFITFTWSRAASLIYCGLRNGYGYRDTVQDIQGIIHMDPAAAAERIRFMLSAQVSNGAGLPLVKYTHHPGREDTPDDESYVRATGHPAYRADDALWLFPTVYKYIAESGDTAFLDEVIPYADHGSDTVYNHLRQAIVFSDQHLGPHGMPAGLHADWNDCLRLGADGESVFVALQYYYALTILRRFAEYKKEDAHMRALAEKQTAFGNLVRSLCWNEDRYIRGFRETGEMIGRRTDPEANLWLNPQSWSVISGLASADEAEKSMNCVWEQLNTEYGAILMDPPYHSHAFAGALAAIFNQGAKENAGIFSQSQGWLILAEALLGHGSRAFTYFMENAPAAQNSRAEIRRMEPYCYGQFTEGRHSPHFGRSHVHWLTGTASTMMVGCVEGILGMRPDIGGLHICPSVPAEWESFEIERDFRGAHLHITVKNPDRRESGVTELRLNGRKMDGDYIPAEQLSGQNDILLIM